jgi:osmotically-inducible protein OsmY
MRSTSFVIAAVVMVLVGSAAAWAVEPIPDQEVADAVDDELMADPATPAWSIDVSVDEGIVTLTGDVDNILAKDRADKLATTVKGVRAVVNRLDVVAPDRSDAAIEQDVRDALLFNDATEKMEVSVAVDDQVVTLTGTTDSWQEKELAGKVANGVKGVTAIENRIELDYPRERADGTIRDEVQRALHWDAYVDDALVDVAVDGGVVTLTGTVGSLAEKREAGIEARVAGVTDVKNELTVESWAREARFRKDKYQPMSNEQIKEAVADALRYDPRVARFDIDVQPKNGYVTLRGIVENLKAKRAAAENARTVIGVWGVENRIKVRPKPPSEARIIDRVEDALKRDPYVERFEIQVAAVGHEVYLDGTVDSVFERAQAEDVASRQKGVRKVNNYLKVHDLAMPTFDPYVDDWYIYDFDVNGTLEQEPPTKADWQIAEQIREALDWSPFVDSDEVTVSVDDGKATLTGTVDTWGELYAARANALDGGAVAVDNELRVEYGPDYYRP